MSEKTLQGRRATSRPRARMGLGQRLGLALLLTVASLGLTRAQGQIANYPSGPVKIVVPFGPGSGSDIATRLLAQHLGTALKQAVVVENKPGANGAIATMAVARANPDGLTLMLGTSGTHGVNPGLVAKLGYDPVKDFAPIGLIATFSSFLVVHPSVPARTVTPPA